MSPRHVRIVALTGLCGCAAVFVVANPWTVIPAVASVLGLVSYTWFKRRWWGGPPWNSWIVALLPFIGVLLGGASPVEALSDPRLGLIMASTFTTYACFVLLGYLKDVDADAATGYDTIPVRFGRKVTVVISAAHAAIGMAASLFLLWEFTSRDNVSFALWTCGWIALAVAHVRLWAVERDVDAHPGVALCALSFVAIHLGEAALLHPELRFPALFATLLAVAAMRRRPSREQV